VAQPLQLPSFPSIRTKFLIDNKRTTGTVESPRPAFNGRSPEMDYCLMRMRIYDPESLLPAEA
jgi:hypothetical protein